MFLVYDRFGVMMILSLEGLILLSCFYLVFCLLFVVCWEVDGEVMYCGIDKNCGEDLVINECVRRSKKFKVWFL